MSPTRVGTHASYSATPRRRTGPHSDAPDDKLVKTHCRHTKGQQLPVRTLNVVSKPPAYVCHHNP